MNVCNLRRRADKSHRGGGAEEAKFKVHGVGSAYAVAVAVPLTKNNIALQKKIDAKENKNALVTLGNKMARSLGKAKTPDDCKHVMRSIETHIAAHKTAGLDSDVKQLYKWLERCRAKCKKLENEHHYEDDAEQKEQQEEEEDTEQHEEKEKLPCASHVIVATMTSVLPLSVLVASELTESMQKIPQHPDFCIARVLTVVKPNASEEKKEEKIVDVSTFDQMPSEYVPGYLAITGTRHDCPLPGVWHELPDARVQMPCSMAVVDTSVLVSDGPSARVLLLPTGHETGETYTFYEQGAAPTFKVFACSMIATHVAFLGVTPGQYTPILVVRERPFLASARRRDSVPRTTIMSFSVPCSTVTLSASDGRNGEATINLGFSDGSFMRLPVPTLSKKQAHAENASYHNIVVYPRKFTALTAKPLSALDEAAAAPPPSEEEKTQPEQQQQQPQQQQPQQAKVEVEASPFVPFDLDGLVAQLTADFPRWAVSSTPFGKGDHLRWSGETLPLHRIVVKGTRAVASGPGGVFVFKLDRQEGDTERTMHLGLGDVASFDFRGGMLAVLKTDTTIQLINAHTLKLETNVPPRALQEGGLPAKYTSSHVAAVTVFDERILFVHADGSSRALEIEDTGFIRSPYKYVAPSSSAADVKSPEIRADFLPIAPPVFGKKRTGKKSKK